MVEEDDIGFGGHGRSGNFFELAAADQRGGVGTVAVLEDFADDLGARAFGKGTEFSQGLFGAEFGDTGFGGGWSAEGGGIARGGGSGSEWGVCGFCFALARAVVDADQERALDAATGIVAVVAGRETWKPGFCFAQATTSLRLSARSCCGRFGGGLSHGAGFCRRVQAETFAMRFGHDEC